VILHNDSAGLWAGELVITRRGTDAGTPMLAEQRLPFHLSARSALTVALDRDVLEPDDGRRELLVAEADGAETAYGYFVENTELHLEPVAKAMAVAVEPTADGYDVTVEAGALVKDLAVFPDRLDPEARVDSALVTLPSGRSHTFRVTGRDLDEVALTTRPVLRSVNDLIAR
jgi:beta-mannosidase